MSVTTKTGDKGQTSLIGGKRVSKSSLRVEAYGTADELSSALGASAAFETDETIVKDIQNVQRLLFNYCSALACPEPERASKYLSQENLDELDAKAKALESNLPPLKCFILPGGTKCAAMLHFCRTICRRMERIVVALSEQEEVDDLVIKIANRLSDYIFLLARTANQKAGVTEETL
ncbi:MAG: cob(I)yrinic acid a,c-diamide adenosyltransferase [bacterium]|nr:cob(I)yrinic acid a,c-diamide adenosyltransferase [bacterium]